MIIKQQQQVL